MIKNLLRLTRNVFLLTLGFIMLTAFQSAFAQKTLKGNVKDETGMPLAGASIVVTGTPVGAQADFDGDFEILVVDSAKSFTVTFLGYKEQVITYEGQDFLDITMKEDRSELDEVVLIGYGQSASRDVTGAISKVKEEAIQRTVNNTLEQALNGRVAGVNTITTDGTPGAGIRIRVRGGTSINANNEPLYVIDGMPIEVNYNEAQSQGLSVSATESSPLANLDPSSIESIEVLKDASATAIYGSRGANGVVMITTKSGKVGKSRIFFDTSMATNFIPRSRFIPLMDVQEWGDFNINNQLYNINRFTGNGSAYEENPTITSNPIGGGDGGPYTPDELRAIYAEQESTDWQDEYYRDGIITNYSLGASGGDEKSLYALRGSYLNNTGAIRNSHFKRYNFNLNLKNNISDKFNVRTVLIPSYTDKMGPLTGGDFNQRNMGSVIRMLTRRPDRGPGVFEDPNDDSGIWVDPITQDQRQRNQTSIFDFTGNTFLTYQFDKHFSFSTRLGTKIQNGKNKNYFPSDFGRGYQDGGVGTRFTWQNLMWNNQNLLNYKNKFGKHRITALLGHEQTYRRRDTESMIAKNFDVETLQADQLGFGLIPDPIFTNSNEFQIISYLSRINYNYAGKYNLTFSYRADGSSKFEDPWGFFPSAAFSWNINREKFLRNSNTISNLKLRMSYGQTANQGVPAYVNLSLMGNTNYVLNDTAVTGLSVFQLGNPDLTWEKTHSYDLGLDYGMFDGRIRFVADLYYKKTFDLLLNEPLPMSTGFSNKYSNIGEVENRGIELILNTVNVDSKDFTWETEFTFSKNDNKILDLGAVEEELFRDQFSNGQFSGIMRVGEQLGTWYGYETAGIFSYDDFQTDVDGNPLIENGYPLVKEGLDVYPTSTRAANPQDADNKPIPFYGDVKYVDQNGDGLITPEDRVIIARTQPKHYGGIFNKFTYKGFELGVFFTYKYGFDVVNGNTYRMNRLGQNNTNRPDTYNDVWTPLNPNASMPRADYNEQTITDRNVEDGSYIRLQSLNISYNLPNKYAKKIGVSSFKIYTNIDNIKVWTKYSGYDPEVSVSSGQRAVIMPNLDYGAYPRTTSIALGLRVGL